MNDIGIANYKLFIHNIDYKTTYDEIFNAFNSIGKMKYCDVPVEKNGRLKGYAFIEYLETRHAYDALNALNNWKIGIRPIRIEFSNPSKEGTTMRNQNSQSNYKEDFPSQRNRRSGRFNNRQSRSYDRYEEDKRREVSNERSITPSPMRKKSGSPRNIYRTNYYKPGEFHDITPSIHEISRFLSKTLDNFSSPNDGRRRERARYDESDDSRRRYYNS